MHTREEIIGFLVNTLKVASDPKSISADAALVEDLGVDSAGVFELILWMEDRFGVHFSPEDIEMKNFATVNVAAGHVERMRAKSSVVADP